MQKKIVALAVAAAFSAPAFADNSNFTIYGKVDLAFGSTSNGTVSTNQISSQVTKLGFKGSEGLDDGLAAIWQIEQQIDIDNAGAGNSTKNTLANRNSFLGLKSDSLGTVLLGRHDTPYKIATRNLDVFADQFADNRHLMGGGTSADTGSYMDARPTDELVYLSPNMNGFKAAASYSAGAETASTAAQVKGSLWSLAGMYDQGPFYGAIAYQNVKYGTAATGQFVPTGAIVAGDSLKGWKLGAGYTMDAFKLNAVYEKITSSMGVTGVDTLGRADWYLAGQYNFGNDDVKLAYTRAGDTNGVANTGANMIGLGYDHNLSKRTSVYAQYAKLSNKSGAKFGFNTAATTAATTGVVNGVSPTGFMLGMKHTF
ncbi:MAG: porin [Nitrosomonadales bacterium]|nr:porin [Nitrosomonadales bacterium]